MKTTYTIALSDGKGGTVQGKRTSERDRTYVACVVQTVTERTVALDAEKREATEKKLVADRALLAARKAKHGLDEAGAKAAQEALSATWFNETDGYWTIFRSVGCKHDRADAEMLKRGFVSPWNVEGPHGITAAAREIEIAERFLASAPPVLGEQATLSWHGTEALAHAAASTARGKERHGHAFGVRTDILAVTKTPKPRASKGTEKASS